MICCNCKTYKNHMECALLDELCDAGFYAQIANEAPTEELRNLFITLVGDEYGHARIQSALLGICPPPISCPPDCACASGKFECDVERAIKGELNSISRYAQLANCAPNTEIRSLLMSILGDEYAHARILTAMMHAPSLCKKRCFEPCCQEPCKEPCQEPCKEPCQEPYKEPCKERTNARCNEPSNERSNVRYC